MATVVLFPPFPFLPAPLKGEREFREIPHVPFFPVSGISGKQTTHWSEAAIVRGLAAICEVLDRCRVDTGARAYFVGRAVVELPKLKGAA
jgi:hypothetical protein